MKNICFILLLFICFFSQAQECEYYKNGKTIEVNDMSIRINTDGTLFHHNEEGHFVNPNIGPGSPGTIRKAGLWIGGYETGTDVLKMAATGFTGDSKSDFYPGPLMPDEGTPYPEILCNYMNRVWKVTREEVVRHVNDYNEDKILDHPNPNIINWPGNGNPYFVWGDEKGLPKTLNGWAPFIDRNFDGIYDPYDGDFPCLGRTGRIPKELYWTVFNDGGGQFNEVTNGEDLRVEVQMTGWVIDCPDIPWMEDYFFAEYKIINQAITDVDSIHAGIWVDFDLGCPKDDYIGSNPEVQTFFAYNADSMDGDENGVCESGGISYYDYSPAMTVTFLSEKMTSFTYFDKFDSLNVNQRQPEQDFEFYRHLTGRWKDGTPYTSSGDGYNPGNSFPETKFAFSDRPSSTNGWSMQTLDSPRNEVYALGSVTPIYRTKGHLPRGAAWRFRVAFGYHHAYRKSPTEVVDWALDYGADDLNQIISPYFSFNHARPCNCPHTLDESFWKKEEEEIIERTFELYPNPTNGKITLNYTGEKAYVLTVYDVARNIVYFDDDLDENKRIDLDLSQLQEGLYFVRLVVDGIVFEERLVKY